MSNQQEQMESQQHYYQLIDKLLLNLNSIILGNPHSIKLATVCLLARGHLLIEDLPGVGKTTLAKNLAHSFGLEFKRVQFTNDLLPSDILGVNIFNTETQRFHFKSGPIFTEALLADEINRANPKTQSALLEAMEEKKVSVDGKSLALPQPFFVIATQNPIDQSGTYPLPESQLDRFLFRIALGYPDKDNEKKILKNAFSNTRTNLSSKINMTILNQLFELVDHVHVSDTVIDYLQSILAKTRDDDYFTTGLSPRAGLLWLKASQALALVEKRDYVMPDDIRELAPYIACHRLTPKISSYKGVDGQINNKDHVVKQSLKQIINTIEVA